MKINFLTILLLTAFSITCFSQESDLKTATEARQTTFPAGKDKKWKAIRALSAYQADDVCDGLFSIYNTIDTGIKGYPEYYQAIFNSLVEINTIKAAETIGRIYETNQPKFIFQSTLFNLFNLTHYEKLFPGILKNLQPDLMNAQYILGFLLKGIKAHKISNEQLISFLPVLDNFYTYIRTERDNPAPKNGYILNIYYGIAGPVLAKCLHTINGNETAISILKDMFAYAVTADSKEKKQVSWEAYMALDKVDNEGNYLSNLCIDAGYRKKVYDYLVAKDQFGNFPAEFNNQAALSEMLAVSGHNLRIHDTDGPETVTYCGTKQVNTENYYFYYICWWKDCKSNSIVVVGPQPADKTKFGIDPRIKGETVKDNVDLNDASEIIKTYEPK